MVLAVLNGEGPLRARLEAVGCQVEICRRLAVADRRRCGSFRGLLQLAVLLVMSIAELWRICSRFHPDLIHTNTSLILTPAIVAKIRGVPHVWHIREVFSDFRGLWRYYQWCIVACSDRIICVSGAVASQFSSRVPAGKLQVIHDGIPVREFADVDSECVAAFRKQHGLSGYTLVGLVGRIKLGRKGQDIFVRVAASIRSRFPDVRFLIIGDTFPGNEGHGARLRGLVTELGLGEAVIYTGQLDDVRAAYAALDISVQCSEMPEAFSGVVIESMAMGKPAIASDCGGTSEQIDHAITGILVPPGSVEQLAVALDGLLADANLRRRLGKSAREKFLACFEFDRYYRKQTSLYLSLTQACKRAPAGGAPRHAHKSDS